MIARRRPWRLASPRHAACGGFAEPDRRARFRQFRHRVAPDDGGVATTRLTAVFTGDASLRRRPMRRVLGPLKLFGAEYGARAGGLMPVTLKGAAQPISDRTTTVTVASAQVKSAMLLAALNAPGRSRISQTEP